MPLQVHQVLQFLNNRARDFGATANDYLVRNNTGDQALAEGTAFFGYISPEEPDRGPYHDLSFVVFPTLPADESWLVALVVGTSGFKDDFRQAQSPGLRRSIRPLLSGDGFCKTSFVDIESSLPREFTNAHPQFLPVFRRYGQYMLAIDVLPQTPEDDGLDGISAANRLSALLAGYAMLRRWPTNQNHRRNVGDAMRREVPGGAESQEEGVVTLLRHRQFVVLTGAPGTGKTRMARRMGRQDRLNAQRVFFTQFHAETSYSDFVYGVRPRLDGGQLAYEASYGTLHEAVSYARDNPRDTVLLIIDEINRANLSNVLGPVFYLFEHRVADNAEDAGHEMLVGGDLRVARVPANLYVIATMNTADRSLAVVDFALRRRFAWYHLRPQRLDGVASFYGEDFDAFAQIFREHASGSELELQPGQGYFLANDEGEMERRIRFELYPLVREYLDAGHLLAARQDFESYFIRRIGQSLHE